MNCSRCQKPVTYARTGSGAIVVLEPTPSSGGLIGTTLDPKTGDRRVVAKGGVRYVLHDDVCQARRAPKIWVCESCGSPCDDEPIRDDYRGVYCSLACRDADHLEKDRL